MAVVGRREACHRGEKRLKASANILLVGSHEPLMDSIAERLRSEAGLSGVATVATPAEALDAVRKHRPEIALIDVDMAEADCLRHARLLGTVQPDIRTIFLGSAVEDRFIEQALTLGASGFLLKRELTDTIVGAIHEVLTGGACFPKEVCSRIVVDSSGARLAPSSGPDSERSRRREDREDRPARRPP